MYIHAEYPQNASPTEGGTSAVGTNSRHTQKKTLAERRNDAQKLCILSLSHLVSAPDYPVWRVGAVGMDNTTVVECERRKRKEQQKTNVGENTAKESNP